MVWEPVSRSDRLAWRLGHAVIRHKHLLTSLFLLGLTVGWLWPVLPDMASREGAMLAFLAVAPSLFAMILMRYTDRTSLEPVDLLLRTFVAGAGLAVLAAMINDRFHYLPDPAHHLLIVGPGEEIVKMLAVLFVAYGHAAFDDAIDGMYYGIAAAAGFAAVETLTWVFTTPNTETWAILAVRTLVSAPSHMLWSAIAGYYLGLGKFLPEGRPALVTKGLVLAALVHGVYDVLVGQGTVGFAAAIIINLALLAFVVGRVRFYYRVLHPTPDRAL